MRLPALRTASGRRAIAALVEAPRRALIAMDFDGTLAPIVSDPAAARAHPRALPILRQIAPYVGRLAVVTGRPAQFVVGPGGLGGLDSLTVLGHYGAEHWEGGRLTSPEAEPGVEVARRQLREVLASVEAPAGTFVEDKGHALAVHVRQTEDPEEALQLLAGPVSALAQRTGLVVEPGRLVLEIRPPGADKGRALRSLVVNRGADAELSAVVFAGDDLGDLPAFDEVARLGTEGVPGLLICSGSGEVAAVAARADLVVDGPEGVVQWLEALAEQLSAGALR